MSTTGYAYAVSRIAITITSAKIFILLVYHLNNSLSDYLPAVSMIASS
ncbi:hypothetical protein [Nostoc sp. JL31]|nr:hypothetical protein [Nostoc sp. JL31]